MHFDVRSPEPRKACRYLSKNGTEVIGDHITTASSESVSEKRIENGIVTEHLKDHNI